MKVVAISHAKCNDGLAAVRVLQHHCQTSRLTNDLLNKNIYLMKHSGNLYQDLEEKERRRVNQISSSYSMGK